jgi:hypothetical protein
VRHSFPADNRGVYLRFCLVESCEEGIGGFYLLYLDRETKFGCGVIKYCQITIHHERLRLIVRYAGLIRHEKYTGSNNVKSTRANADQDHRHKEFVTFHGTGKKSLYSFE